MAVFRRLDFLLFEGDFLFDAESKFALAFEKRSSVLDAVQVDYVEYERTGREPKFFHRFGDYFRNVARK